MKTKKIVFTDIGKAELMEFTVNPVKENEILVETEYTAVSAGTERANLMRMPNLGDSTDGGTFPKILGYSGVGYVIETGSGVKNFKVGDRVITMWGQHSSYNVLPEKNAVKADKDSLPSEQAAFLFISTFSAAGVRKTRLEFGESAIVFGIGILGAFAVQFLRLAGAVPVIAADISEQRRKFAIDIGADYAFNPADDDFAEKIKSVTHGRGAASIIESTGYSAALKQALDVAAHMSRIALLGCTRVSETPIDFYQKVHRPGVEIIGAHTDARPSYESYPHHWTYKDDITAVMDFIDCGRIDISKMISEIHTPENAREVYLRLAENNNFPVGVAFKWR